jgi:small subunit ribosomal protein S9
VIADEGGNEAPGGLESQQPAAGAEHEPVAPQEKPAEPGSTGAEAADTPTTAADTPATAGDTPATAADTSATAADTSAMAEERSTDVEGAPTDAEGAPIRSEETPTKAKPRKRSERRSPSRAKKGAAAEATKDDRESERPVRAAQKKAASAEPTVERTSEAGAEAAGESAEAAAQSGQGALPGEEATPAAETSSQEDAPDQARAPRAKPEVPGAHLEVDIVPEGVDPLGRELAEDPYAISYEEELEEPQGEEPEQPAGGTEEELAQPIVSAAIDLAAGARYRATGKRKTAVARVILRPGAGAYTINGRALQQYFPRATLQRNICQPLEAVGYQDRMDVLARLHGGGVSSQAGALRHGISRALLEADPSLRSELKRRGFLTRDSRVKERKKAGLKKARKRPQFSKR